MSIRRILSSTLLTLTLALASSIAAAEEAAAPVPSTPAEVAHHYFELLHAQEWIAAAGLFDADSLAEFRELMKWINDPEWGGELDGLRATFFGPEADSESVATLSDEEYFAQFFQGIMQQIAALGGFDFKKLEVLGSLPEGDDVVHVVTRNQLAMGEIEMEAMEVLSLRQTEQGWKILLSGKLKGLPQQLKATVTAGRAGG